MELANNLALAPMAGVTNRAFRALCVEGGAGLVVSEMVSAESIRHGNRKTLKLLSISPSEHPIALQIFGSDPDSMAAAAAAAQETGADIVDINAGCPVKKVLRSGSGAALMGDPARLETIVKRAVGAVSIPVTVKIRCGLVQGEALSPDLARRLEGAGASAITLHGRPASQHHSGPVNHAALAATAAAVRIPVIGNGGVRTAEDAAKVLGTGCAGVAIGRAAVEDPSIFMEIAEGLADPSRRPGTGHSRRIGLFIRFLELNSALYGGDDGVVRARKLVGYWLKGFPNSSALRCAFMRVGTLNEARTLLLQYTDEEHRP